jgi:membrane protease YdiL (CAAX protease family)
MKKERALEIRSVLWVYGTLFLLCFLGDYLAYHHVLGSWKASELSHPGFIVFGIFFACFYVVVASICTRLFRWAAQLEQVFSQVLTPLSYFQTAQLAVVSGFIEEWFFRGVLYAHLGLVTSSLLFGLSHFLPGRSLWKWPLVSTLTGFVFGALYYYSHSLWLCAWVHTSMNAMILLKLNQSKVGSTSFT